MENNVCPQFMTNFAIAPRDVKLGFALIPSVRTKKHDRLSHACRDDRVGVGGEFNLRAIRHRSSFRACVGALHDRRGGSARKRRVAPSESPTA